SREVPSNSRSLPSTALRSAFAPHPALGRDLSQSAQPRPAPLHSPARRAHSVSLREPFYPIPGCKSSAMPSVWPRKADNTSCEWRSCVVPDPFQSGRSPVALLHRRSSQLPARVLGVCLVRFPLCKVAAAPFVLLALVRILAGVSHRAAISRPSHPSQ